MRNTPLATIIGLTQEETAMWLCIPRSQWSMYESGKRDLPHKSSLEFSSLLQHLTSNEAIAEEVKNLMNKEEKELQARLQMELVTLKHELFRLQQKTAAFEETRTKCFAALKTANYIESNPKMDSPRDLGHCIKIRAMQTLEKYPLSRLEKMKEKAEMLSIQRQRVEEKLKGYSP